jgi:polysaccharide biosynthesis transport protein
VINTLKVRPEFSPLSVARAIWKRKWQIVAVWVLGSAACAGVVYRMRPIYAATAVILVESQRIPEAFVTATVQTPLEARLDMLKQQVLSRDLLWGLVDDLKLYTEERRHLTKEEVLRIFRDDIKINLLRGWSSRGPGAFEVAYEAPKPWVAAEVSNRVGNFFINENLRQRTGEAEATSQFLNQQLAEAEDRLRENEATLKEFKLTHNGELPQQEAALLAGMSQSRTELLGIQDALGRAHQNRLLLDSSADFAQAALRDRQERLRREAARPADAPAAAGTAHGAPEPPAVPPELERAREELAALRGRYYDSHPDVVRKLREVQGMEAALAAAPKASQNAPNAPPVPSGTAAAAVRTDSATDAAESRRVEELRSQLAVQTSDIENLERRRQRVLDEIADMQARMRKLPVREQQLASITRDYETCKTNYQSLLNKKMAADVAANMEKRQRAQKFVMLDGARIPQKPVRPKTVLLISSGALLSLLLGAALAYLLELRANVVLGEWELPSDVRILGRVPRLPAVNH